MNINHVTTVNSKVAGATIGFFQNEIPLANLPILPNLPKLFA